MGPAAGRPSGGPPPHPGGAHRPPPPGGRARAPRPAPDRRLRPPAPGPLRPADRGRSPHRERPRRLRRRGPCPPSPPSAARSLAAARRPRRARGDEPAHEPLDLRYLVVAPDGATITPDLAELHAVRWVAWDEVSALGPDPGLRRGRAQARRFFAG